MHRRFIALIIAASVAITSLGATPVFAGEKETARTLAALLGIAIVGKIIHDKNKKGDLQVHVPQRQPTPPLAGDRVIPRPIPDMVQRSLLPSHCLRVFDTYDGPLRVFGKKCLRRNYVYADSLPRYCLRRVETYRGLRKMYDARCLRYEGYQMARH